ncbi:cytochrome b/b6 domain-containing protein [Ideonella sp.]|uniref:cytochrome b/b6 domain-containing protein n=1 Tax=Ideonella sp. TaxID=1929293 RepID=UPI002B462F85|nr:cytochrome b/b6 domain-containing protein [Ideonella sp.]HJV72254.1 cytochrome b/b6 domain-containing protein [Ideonella sp.]
MTTPALNAGGTHAADPVAAADASADRARILVWDAPVRVMHWLMVLSFAGAWLSAESERWRLLHITLGYTLAGLVAARLVWGLVGTQHARFVSFVRGPTAALDYLRALLQGRAPHFSGHNPAGALAIVGLLALAAATTALGWAVEAELGGDWLEEAHEALATGMLALVGLHVLGVVVGSLAHRENLARAMFTGRKLGPARDAIGRRWRALALVILIFVASFWAWQWQSSPAADTPAAASAGGHDDDDDDDD